MSKEDLGELKSARVIRSESKKERMNHAALATQKKEENREENRDGETKRRAARPPLFVFPCVAQFRVICSCLYSFSRCNYDKREGEIREHKAEPELATCSYYRAPLYIYIGYI